MRIFNKVFLGILFATTLSLLVTAVPGFHYPQLTLTRITKCDDAALSKFMPMYIPPLGTPFKDYLKELHVCKAPPLLTDPDAKKHFWQDYHRFAYYYNANIDSSVPMACRVRFQMIGKGQFEKLPSSWIDYRRVMEMCGSEMQTIDSQETSEDRSFQEMLRGALESALLVAVTVAVAPFVLDIFWWMVGR